EGEERCVEHGGAAITAPLLAEYGIADYMPADEKDSRFSNVELAVTYAMLNAGEIAKVEQDLKLLPSYEMGGIIGRVKLPSLSLYRKRIPIITAQMDMRDVILETSKSMHELLCFSDVVYIDGHFMAYHGVSNTLYGYNPQKRLAMHGREYFFVHDRDGLPVYATISDGYRKSKHYIEDVDKKLRYIYGVKKKELLEVFDRGGYSKEFCVEISDTIRFICWRSDARSLPKGIKAAEWVEVNIEHQGNDYGQVEEKTFYAWERKAVFDVGGKKAAFREIWIRKSRQTSPVLSNDFETSLEDLVRNMTRRWGAQENMFKELNGCTHQDHGIVRLSDEKKLFFDWLKMNAIWAKREIVEIVKPLYKDLRDVNKFVKSILRSRTYVRKNGEVLYVSFPPQRSKKSARALEQLCVTLNEYGDIDLGLNLKRIIFSVRGKY
ncbi:MAG: hypothetical protein NWE87_01770, partial [Candidatus Bathyarchaeota archaeon]|nr:hypothetical protein [Candidatus Bathyarchaeota archaeon]